jgi:hypothetical protein
MKPIPALFALLALGSFAQGAITFFDLLGNAGPGLLGGNEAPTPVTGGGSGGELGSGIFFDDATNLLTINIGWGSGNGFTDLTGNANAGHIHGPTSSPAPASFSQATGVRYGLDTLPGWNPSATNGGFVGTVTILPADVTPLFEGRFYINVHTPVNGGGEIRGQIVVPEPGTAMALMAGLAGLTLRRRPRR